ncbi:hypothetical protein A6I84_19125 [Prescottella equi]|nr:hypothetical protein A6I84_19125 [Prescottella equi]
MDLFKKRYPDVIPTLSRTAETDAWKAAEAAGDRVSIKKVTAIHRGIDASAIQEFGIGGTARQIGEYHQILKFQSEPESGTSLTKLREYFFPSQSPEGVSVDGGNISFSNAEDGGADEDEADELVAEVSYPGGKTQSIRCSGARPPLITYPIEVGNGDDPDNAFRREARHVVKSLVANADAALPEKWDDGPWTNVESLQTWKVSEFYDTTQPLR